MSSSSAFFVLATNRRDTEDLKVERGLGLHLGAHRLVGGRVAGGGEAASIRSMTTADNTSSSAKVA